MKNCRTPANQTLTISSGLLFTAAGLLFGGCIFIMCMKGIGMGSSPAAAPMFSLMGMVFYAVGLLMATDNLNQTQRLSAAIVLFALSLSAIFGAVALRGWSNL